MCLGAYGTNWIKDERSQRKWQQGSLIDRTLALIDHIRLMEDGIENIFNNRPPRLFNQTYPEFMIRRFLTF